ncbi:uncharacterized protein STEHIDRAFT_137223 [Stereum hirsutum FP-91666 SS1]|uniref:uncharacterized protein n=1 Tax=Stereum hirsutum (strain FP-91666) TaxID=721885 RepID=UPI0004409F79|nr:uncharacterized protein STEHIDRAFT_137223 [Stereum hirsutum FP-91666 SS1]EIM91589.1 hypothetical protein STEHIDRAFT_137223 [Stereum hirsutum FP-91666 SS1]
MTDYREMQHHSNRRFALAEAVGEFWLLVDDRRQRNGFNGNKSFVPCRRNTSVSIFEFLFPDFERWTPSNCGRTLVVNFTLSCLLVNSNRRATLGRTLDPYVVVFLKGGGETGSKQGKDELDIMIGRRGYIAGRYSPEAMKLADFTAFSLLGGFFLGMFSLLILFSTYAVMTSSITLRAKLFKVGITFVLYGISIGNLVGTIAICTIPMELRTFLTVEQLVILLGATNYMLSDAVVIWRCWLLWGKSRWVLIILAVLYTAAFASAIASVVSHINDTSATLRAKVMLNADDRYNVIMWFLSLGTNVFATMIVAFKAWKHRRQLRAILHDGSRKNQLERLMTLLVDSGVLYCVIWIAFIIAFSLTETDSRIMNVIMVEIAGIYPTILIVLINYRTTQRDNEWGYGRNDLEVQRQERRRVEASQPSRPYDLHGVFITQDQSHGDDVVSGGMQEVDIADRKVPGTLL